MIYITGDTHGEFGRLSKKKLFNQGIAPTEQDYLIICGDFGLCWANDRTFEYHCKNFEQKPYTILWVQGNHENYDMIAKYPVEEWHGGKVRHILREKVILLERGQVFELEGKTFFTFGGASSHDIEGGVLDRRDPDFEYKRKKANDRDLPYRIIHESWWPQELPSEEEMQEGIRNLERHENKVDYIITHCCLTSIQNMLNEWLGYSYEPDVITEYFQEIEEMVDYNQWYFGHYHRDQYIDEKHRLVYQEMIPLDECACNEAASDR